MSHSAPRRGGAFRTTARAIPALAGLLVTLLPAHVRAQCAETAPFKYYTGATQAACPCFVAGEMAGVVFEVPAADYPIEITRVGIAWGSQFGGTGQSIEQAIRIYAGGLPNPGVPIFNLIGPQLTDGVINEFNLAPIPGEIRIESGPFTVALEFQNDNAGNFFAPSVVHDANGCTSPRNVIYATPGGWGNACSAGVSGDWVMYVRYRSLKVTAQGSPSEVVFSGIPANQTTCTPVTVTNTGCDTLTIAGISGCDNAPFSVDTTLTAHVLAPGAQTSISVCATPTDGGAQSCEITVHSNASNGPLVFDVSIDGVTAAGAAPSRGFALLGVVPNPFNPATTIRFQLPAASTINADVWSVDGARVRTLARSQTFPAGTNEVPWDGRDDAGRPVASGVYLVRVATPAEARVTRALLLK